VYKLVYVLGSVVYNYIALWALVTFTKLKCNFQGASWTSKALSRFKQNIPKNTLTELDLSCSKIYYS